MDRAFVLTSVHSYYDDGAKSDVTVALYRSREAAETALAEWVREAVSDWYGVSELDADQEKDVELAIENRNIGFAGGDETIQWFIEERPIK